MWTRAWGEGIRSSVDLARGETESAIAHARASLTVKHRLGDTLGMAMCVDTLAQAALAAGGAGHAARLLAVSRRMWEVSGPSQFGSPELRAARDLCEQRARALIGDRVYDTAFDEGSQLGLDAALSLALGYPPRAPVAQKTVLPRPSRAEGRLNPA